MGDLSMRDSGGKEKEYETQSASIPESTNKRKKQMGGMAKVQRDAEGNIVSVEESEIVRNDTAWGPALNSEDEDEMDEEEEDEDVESQEEDESPHSKTNVTKCEYCTLTASQSFCSTNKFLHCSP